MFITYSCFYFCTTCFTEFDWFCDEPLFERLNWARGTGLIVMGRGTFQEQSVDVFDL